MWGSHRNFPQYFHELHHTVGTGVWDPSIKAKTRLDIHLYIHFTSFNNVSTIYLYLSTVSISQSYLDCLANHSLSLQEHQAVISRAMICQDMMLPALHVADLQREQFFDFDILWLILIVCCGQGGLSFRWRQQHGWRRATGRWISFHPHAKLIQDSRDSLDALHAIIADCYESG